jgi:hypothetical protein
MIKGYGIPVMTRNALDLDEMPHTEGERMPNIV